MGQRDNRTTPRRACAWLLRILCPRRSGLRQRPRPDRGRTDRQSTVQGSEPRLGHGDAASSCGPSRLYRARVEAPEGGRRPLRANASVRGPMACKAWGVVASFRNCVRHARRKPARSGEMARPKGALATRCKTRACWGGALARQSNACPPLPQLQHQLRHPLRHLVAHVAVFGAVDADGILPELTIRFRTGAGQACRSQQLV